MAPSMTWWPPSAHVWRYQRHPQHCGSLPRSTGMGQFFYTQISADWMPYKEFAENETTSRAQKTLRLVQGAENVSQDTSEPAAVRHLLVTSLQGPSRGTANHWPPQIAPRPAPQKMAFSIDAGL